MTQLPPKINLDSLISEININQNFKSLLKDKNFFALTETLRRSDAFSISKSKVSDYQISNRAIAILRKMKTVYAMTAKQFTFLMAELTSELNLDSAEKWGTFSDDILNFQESHMKLSKLMLKYSEDDTLKSHFDELVNVDPHAIYPTSSFRTCVGTVNSDSDGSYIEAVMSLSTMTEIKITEGVLNLENTILKNLYKPLERCVCLIDSNVEEYYGNDIKAYFAYHDIALKLLVYRAMEVDKGIGTVERIMADFKELGVSRQQPVLIIGGGVITDVGGLACALYHRGTPYVMLATSIVSGIDAGPSPRTCCDGFGFKNLFGAYHAPVLTLTDRTFFKTLKTGWIRHGIAEIIKMAVVKDIELFELLEEAGIDLLYSKFGAEDSTPEINQKSLKVLSLAMKSYVEAEYGNLYETHQCRPHAYGHTWSPGYEIPSGMLHGHAISCGMGLGAYMSCELGWISTVERDRILQLISDFELSLWHPVMEDIDMIYKAQVKIIEKRGGNLVAPLPKGEIGKCGYLNELSKEQLGEFINGYKQLCTTYPRLGYGIEPLCSDVGLEDPSTVAHSNLEPKAV